MEEEKNGFAEESSVKSQEPSGFAEESSIKSQEPSEDIIYDLSEPSESSESSESSEPSDNDDNDENADNAENDDNAENHTEAEKKLKKMVAEMGAETVLEIIRDIRNAAIRQILAEVEAQRQPLQSGVSAARPCNSIFDLAALA